MTLVKIVLIATFILLLLVFALPNYIGYGQAKFLEDYNEKVEGLTVMSEHYEKKGPFEFGEEKVNRLLVIKIEIEKMTGKESGF